MRVFQSIFVPSKCETKPGVESQTTNLMSALKTLQRLAVTHLHPVNELQSSLCDGRSRLKCALLFFHLTVSVMDNSPTYRTGDYLLHSLTLPLPVNLSVCLCTCLSTCLSINLSVCPPVCQPVCLSVHLSVHLSVCAPACQPVCLSACLSICLSTCLSFHLPVNLSVCAPVCPPACIPVCLSTCLSNHLNDTNISRWRRIFSASSSAAPLHPTRRSLVHQKNSRLCCTK